MPDEEKETGRDWKGLAAMLGAALQLCHVDAVEWRDTAEERKIHFVGDEVVVGVDAHVWPQCSAHDPENADAPSLEPRDFVSGVRGGRSDNAGGHEARSCALSVSAA